jgi:hypothetical protein
MQRSLAITSSGGHFLCASSNSPVLKISQSLGRIFGRAFRRSQLVIAAIVIILEICQKTTKA